LTKKRRTPVRFSQGVPVFSYTETGLQVPPDRFSLRSMNQTTLVLFAAGMTVFLASCAADSRPEMPGDQETKVRYHRTTPSEDLDETGQTKEGALIPPTKEGSWKF